MFYADVTQAISFELRLFLVCVLHIFTFKNGYDKIVFFFHRTFKTISRALCCSEKWGSYDCEAVSS